MMQTLKKAKASGRVVTGLLLAVRLVLPTRAQERPAAAQRNKLQLSVECRRQNEWRSVDAQSVFEKQDRIRFRFRSSVSGYLYILNDSSGGQVSWLYPASGTSSNHVEAGHEVIIPRADASYVIAGPPGVDTLYWILRSTPFQIPQVHSDQLDGPSTLISRCSEEESRRETACVDESAGPKPVPDPKKLQTALGISDSLVARDLTFEAKPQTTEIGTDSDGASGGILYQVRIAHR